MYQQKRNFTTHAFGRPAQCVRKKDWRDENDYGDDKRIKSGRKNTVRLFGGNPEIQESVRYYQNNSNDYDQDISNDDHKRQRVRPGCKST